MTKRQDLYLQRRSRSEQSDQHQPNQAKSISHEPRASPDSTPLASRIEFPTMTMGYLVHINADGPPCLDHRHPTCVLHRYFFRGLFASFVKLHVTLQPFERGAPLHGDGHLPPGEHVAIVHVNKTGHPCACRKSNPDILVV